jgi:fructose-1,6-bisphosphatase/inositol monophosphatase family enzyme
MKARCISKKDEVMRKEVEKEIRNYLKKKAPTYEIIGEIFSYVN